MTYRHANERTARPGRLRGVLAAAAAACVLASAAGASAQMFERPYEFRGGTTGMDTAAKQAILRQQLLDQTPDNIMRGPGGTLLTITNERGGAAIVRAPDGTFLPGIRSGDPGFLGSFMGQGLVPAMDGGGGAAYGPFGYYAAMDGWISQVNTLDPRQTWGPRLTYTSSALDTWVGQANELGPRRY